LCIESDASLSGWGAFCNGVSTRGKCSLSEAEYHINYLELLAAFFALQSFLPHHSSVKHVRLKMDNTTAVANINNLGSIKSPLLNGLSRSIWDWCIMHNIHVSAESVPGSCNVIGDNFSREDSSRLKWSLNNSIFNKLIELVFKPDIDLCASRLNKKLPMFVSWSPELGCYAVNAFNISWSNFQCYAFPPFVFFLEF